MPKGWKGSEIWRKIILGIFYFRLFKSLWGSIAGSKRLHRNFRGSGMGGDYKNNGRPALRRRTSCVLTPDVRRFSNERSAETKSETWNIILERARIITIGFTIMFHVSFYSESPLWMRFSEWNMMFHHGLQRFSCFIMNLSWRFKLIKAVERSHPPDGFWYYL